MSSPVGIDLDAEGGPAPEFLGIVLKQLGLPCKLEDGSVMVAPGISLDEPIGHGPNHGEVFCKHRERLPLVSGGRRSLDLPRRGLAKCPLFPIKSMLGSRRRKVLESVALMAAFSIRGCPVNSDFGSHAKELVARKRRTVPERRSLETMLFVDVETENHDGWGLVESSGKDFEVDLSGSDPSKHFGPGCSATPISLVCWFIDATVG